MAFHVVDYKGVRLGQQAKIVFSHRTMAGVSNWLGHNQTEADTRICRYAIDADHSTWVRYERRMART